MRLSKGRIPDYIFEDKDKSKMEKKAQYDDFDGFDDGDRGWDEGQDDLRDMGDNEGWEDGIDEMREQQEMEDITDEASPQLQDMIDEFSKGQYEFQAFTIIPDGEGRWSLWGHGYYGDGSVLAGQSLDANLETFDSLEEAKAQYPAVSISDSRPLSSNSVSDLPYAGFDEADAGEIWDEDY